MNLSILIQWALGVILALSAVKGIDDIHKAIFKSQTKLIYETRASAWGSPRIFSENKNQ